MVDVYEQDLKAVTCLIAIMGVAFDEFEKRSDAYPFEVRMDVRSKHDYTIGQLVYEGEQWKFIPEQSGEDE